MNELYVREDIKKTLCCIAKIIRQLLFYNIISIVKMQQNILFTIYINSVYNLLFYSKNKNNKNKIASLYVLASFFYWAC